MNKLFTYQFGWVQQFLPGVLFAFEVEAGEAEELQLDSRWSQGLQILHYVFGVLDKLLLVLVVVV